MGPSLVTDMPPWIDEVAAEYGLQWGGNFNGRKDAMHFECHLTPAQVAVQRLKLEDGVSQADVIAALKSQDGQAALEKAVDHLMSQGLTGDREGAIRAWAVKLDQTADNVRKIMEHLNIPAS
jgi:hypothetical protein